MRILIDECIDERFRNSLPGHDCQTARYAGLAGLTNGELLVSCQRTFLNYLTAVAAEVPTTTFFSSARLWTNKVSVS